MTETLTELIERAKSYEKKLPAFPAGGQVSADKLSAWIDHTLLKPEATPAQVRAMCEDALKYQFAAVCVNPVYIKLVARLLQDSPVKPCTVVGFPLGVVPTRTKTFETRQAMRQGALEIDMVIPVGLLKGGQVQYVYDDIRAVAEETHARGGLLKVILETCLLTHSEKILGTVLTQAAGADFVKTSTGFSSGGATPEDVALMRRIVGPVSQMGVKAAGGIRSLADAQAMLEAGASRIGTSAGVKLVEESLVIA
jgi:deoxyribose-phosphate aldolase